MNKIESSYEDQSLKKSCKQLNDQLSVCLELLSFSDEQTDPDLKATIDELEKLSASYMKTGGDKKSLMGGFNLSSSDLFNANSSLNLTSPLSTSNQNLSLNSSAYPHIIRSQLAQELNEKSPESLRKDIIRLTEENKYLKKRSPNTLTNKCSMCSNYIDVIDMVKKEKQQIQNDFVQLEDMMKQTEVELNIFKSKCQELDKDLLEKIEREGVLRKKVQELEVKNGKIEGYVQTVLESKDGFEDLQRSVTELSLALISQSELSLRHKELIRDLFTDSQKQAIQEINEKCNKMEFEKEKYHDLAKRSSDRSKQTIKTLRKYAISVKECVDLYNFIDQDSVKFKNETHSTYFIKHVNEFLEMYGKDAKGILSQVDKISNELQDDILDIQRQSDQFDEEKFDKMLDSNALLKSPEISKSASKKSIGLDGKNFTLGRCTQGSKNDDDNPFHHYSPYNESNLSQNDRFSLLKSLEFKDERISELEGKLKECESIMKKRTKRKGLKAAKKTAKNQDKREIMIQDTLDELQMLVDEDCEIGDLLNEQPTPKENILDRCMNETINEADEKDEEETLFDKDGNRLSARSHDKEIEVPNLMDYNKKFGELELSKIDDRKYNTASDQERTPRAHNLIPDYNLSIESESVKIDEDLLNDSIKFDEQLL